MNEQLFNKLKSASDIVPDTHDGSYELVQKTVEAYASMDSLTGIDYNDLDLIYYMSVGSWKKHGISFDKKRNAINKSHLDGERKQKLNEVISEVMVKANNSYYENTDENEPSTGMFAASFQTILGAANDKNEYLSKPNNLTLWNQQIKEFIAMLIDISRMNDDEKIFKRAESIFNNGIRGLQAGTASQILHCLKPNTFPILNSVGRRGYSTLGVFLQKPSELKYYIANCRKIKRFRDENFAIRNYRTFDRLFWEVVDKIDFEKIIAFLKNYGGRKYVKNSAAENRVIENEGKTARNLFFDFCKNSVDVDKQENLQFKCSYWQNSGNISKYFWCPIKKKQYENKPYSIAFAFETIANELTLIVKLELQKERTPEQREKFNLNSENMSIEGENTGFIVYGESTSGGEILDKEGALNRLQKENADRICPVYVLTKPYTIERTKALIEEASNAVELLWPFYEKLINDNSPIVQPLFSQKGNMEMKQSKNIILYGPPGTGKTFYTMAYAVAIIERRDFNDVKVEANEDYSKVKERYENYKKKGLIDFVTFHQSYGYEEFVQGIKPVTKNGSISYEVQDGIFKKFCDNAKKDKNSSYVFIIDEINRGNISKIFGELITLIEDTKREGADEEMKVTLPYIDKEGQPVSFSVPQNVYIIGTMNTADRSIAAMDTALRRRFQFEEMMPKAELLEGIQIIDQSGNDTKINVQSILETINRRIEALYDREHTIGHAYFMPLRESGTLEKLADIFKTKIIPLLQEYFYDDYEKIRLVLGDNQKKDDRQFVSKKEVNNTQLFGEGVDELLSDNRYTYEIKSAAFDSPDAYRYIYESDRTSVKVEE